MSQYRIKRKAGKGMAIVGGSAGVGLKIYDEGYAIRVGEEVSDEASFGEDIVFQAADGKTYIAHVDLPEGSDESNDVETCLPDGWVAVVVDDAEPEDDDGGDGGGDDGGEEVEVEVDAENAA
jgi:hypothetical protein